jgi:hypothetical protein
MSSCYCIHEKVTTHCYDKFVDSSDDDDCKECLVNQINLIKLKNTNYELKDLISRLDKLSTSVESKLVKSNNFHSKHRRDVYLNECNLCKSANMWNKKETYQYDLTICDDCQHMIKLAEELERKEKWKNVLRKKDPNVYPLSKYPSGKQYECDKCERCLYERSRSRSRSGRRRSQSSRRSRSYSYSPVSSYRVKTPEPRPIWNGGPYTQSYLWREWKLKEEKK